MTRGAEPPFRPRRRFGQHFLHDPAAIARIVDAVAPRETEHLVEIGPGLGAITRPLLAHCRTLDAIEIDRDLAAALEHTLGGDPRLRVHRADALAFDLASLGTPVRVVGNLPYNVSTPLLLRLVEQRACVIDMHLMLQREVAERLAAAPGGGAYGRLGVMVGLHCEVTRLFGLGAGAFRPAPRVASAFVRVRPRPHPEAAGVDPERFARVVAAAFSRRRKMLRNALAGLVSEAGIRAAGLDPQRRPETLSIAEFAALAGVDDAP